MWTSELPKKRAILFFNEKRPTYMSNKYLLKKIIVATTTRSCKGMKVVSSRTLELRSALPQIWKERKTLSNNATMSSGKLSTSAPPPPHFFTHQTLLVGRVLGMLSILTAAMYGRQFHQSWPK
jgi:hypothetical protein